MSTTHKIIFYPVGHGDTSQVILQNGRRILFDFCHKAKSEDSETPEIDLKKRLREELREANKDYLDVVALTHADKDHIQGSTDFFWLQHAARYQDATRVKIRELWVPAAMVVDDVALDERSAEFAILRKEARHRLLEGKDILVFSKPQRLMDWLVPRLKERGESPSARDHLFVDAGTLVPGFTLESDDAEFFCHSPFIIHCDGGDIIRNAASLVFNVRIRAGTSVFDYFEVGDSSWEDLESIVRTTRAHRNDDRLEWDIFNIPHHCSYLSLSDEKGDRETVPKPLVRELLLSGKPHAYIVSCSEPILSTSEAYEQIQPPHVQARNAYKSHLEQVGGRSFLVTMEEPSITSPKPIVFELSSDGVAWKKEAASGSAAIISSVPPRAG